MKQIYFFTIIILLSISSITSAQNYKTITACPADSIKAWMKQNNVPGVAVGIIENDKITSINTYGNIRPGVATPVNTLWNVASLTKPITALTVLKLVNEGKWNLDEPVSKYWVDPDIKDNPYTAKLTTRILLSHSSGFPNWRWMNKDNKLYFKFEPGTQMGYSGEGYQYLLHALENKFGKTLQQLASEELFVPVGMTDTRYSWSKELDSTRFAEAYDEKGVKYNHVKNTQIIAADWLITSITDYCKFGLYVINGAGLSKSLYSDMATVHTLFENTEEQKFNGMGLGWQVVQNLPNGEFVLTHSGSDDGVKTVIVLFPNSKRGIVIFTNGQKGDKVKNAILQHSKIDLQPELTKHMGEFIHR